LCCFIVLRISFVCTLFVWSLCKELSSVVNANSLLAGLPANMVRGSGPDSGAEDKSKRMYDGKLDSWPSAKIKLKSLLYRSGLWDVTQNGVSICSDTPAHANADASCFLLWPTRPPSPRRTLARRPLPPVRRSRLTLRQPSASTGTSCARRGGGGVCVLIIGRQDAQRAEAA
jgi:hypothetical protein